MSMIQTLRGLVADNPVLDKEAGVALRGRLAPIAVLVLGGSAFAALVIAHLDEQPSRLALSQWAGLEPSGQVMFTAVVALALALESLLLPALAVNAIAGERERGTLPLLVNSALSPARIVAGKMLGLVALAAPMMLLYLPILVATSAFGGVELWHALAAALFIAVHGVAVLAVSLAGSAFTKRTRSAAAFVMLMGQIPALAAGTAGIALLAHYVDNSDAVRVAAPFLLGVGLDLLLIFTGLFLTWDQLAPKRAPRTRWRFRMLAAYLFGVPVLMGALQLFLPQGHGTREDALIGMFFQTAIVALIALLVGVTTADRVYHGARSPGVQALVCGALVAAGIVVSRALPFGAELPSLHSAKWLSAIYVALYTLFIATSAAALSRFVKTPPVRIVLTVILHLALFIGSIAAHEAHRLLGVGRNAFMWMNPVGVVEAIERNKSFVDLGFIFVGFAIVISLLVCFVGRRRPEGA